MRYLRKHRCRLGVALAAVFLLTAVMPGLVAAAQGVQLQAHICSADGTQAPAEGLRISLRTNIASSARPDSRPCR